MLYRVRLVASLYFMTEHIQKIVQVVRSPIVVILGHVDHGKTTILDYIRKTKIADKEAGGITQHIGAYQVEHQEKIITFLDTPGHEAFSAIRSRGVKVADIAILVIAADEGLKPQTKESIKILKENNIPFVVAINKIDINGANPMKVRQQLAEQDVLVEDYGGQIPVNELSAKTGDGLNALLETVLLLAEMEELTANTESQAKGVVIEAHINKLKGIVATLLVHDGTIKTGDLLIAGSAICKIKALEDFLGKRINQALPSQPCVVLGWGSLPALGSTFEIVKDKKIAEKQAKEFKSQTGKLFAIDEPEVEVNSPEIVAQQEITKYKPFIANLIVKTDVQSSLEAIDQTLRTIKSNKVAYKVVDYGVGIINDTDIKNAKVKQSSIIGFHVGIDKSAIQMAERENIIIVTSNIIYKLVEVVSEIMTELLPVEIKRTSIGKLKILATFGTQDKSQIVGGKVTIGKAVRGITLDVIRDSKVLGTGKLTQLQQSKEDVKVVIQGNECGIRFEPSFTPPSSKTTVRQGKASEDKPVSTSDFTIQVGDILEFFEEEKIKGEL